ncbi:MAG: adenine deaminase [Thermoplasmata archaeon]
MIRVEADILGSGSIDGQIVDLISGEIFPGMIEFSDGVITRIKHLVSAPDRMIVPGLIDSHIHIESSHLCPSRFAEAVMPHGTTCVVSDPHEIANVFGIAGIRYMISDSKRSPLRCYFTAPSCVPATPFETSGACLTHKEVREILSWPEVVALGEMMNFPGAVSGDEEVMRKIEAAKEAGKPIDGHAPLLSGGDLSKYVSRGIRTDHECTSAREALEKHNLGMIIQVRNGTACKNLKALADFAKKHPFMLVSDDKSAHDLLRGHLDESIREAISLEIDPLSVLRAATLFPAEHYALPGGWFEEGRAADFAVIDGLESFNVMETWIAGKRVARNGKTEVKIDPIGFDLALPRLSKKPSDFSLRSGGTWAKVRVIVAQRDEIVTGCTEEWLRAEGGEVLPDSVRDILRISVVNRYRDAPVSNGFVKGFGLKRGAIASTVAHDSHNCIVLGIEKEHMSAAANASLETGGFALADEKGILMLELPVAGLMSTRSAEEVSESAKKLLAKAKELGCALPNPFMTMSFMSLLVIPKLKLGDRGLFDVEKFEFVDPVVEISERSSMTERDRE